MVTPAVIPKPDTAVADTIAVKSAVAAMAVDADDADSVVDADYDDCALQHPLSINIRPILKSVAGVLTDHEIDQWFVEMEQANEKHGIRLELTGEGELVISPMVNRKGLQAEAETITDLRIWSRQHGGEAYGANANMRLPDGSRIRPDALWLSPEQLAELPALADDRPITVCPAFVVEIMSGTDSLPPLQRKMELYIANGAKLGWLIIPRAKQVHIYRPGVPVAVLDDPETISGDPTLPGFTFAVRQRIFALHD